jgi:hypothetical protein
MASCQFGDIYSPTEGTCCSKPSPRAESGYLHDDVDGAAPKLLAKGMHDLLPVAPDGKSFLCGQKGRWVVHSIAENTEVLVPRLQPNESPDAWAADSKHVFTQKVSDTGISIARLDLATAPRGAVAGDQTEGGDRAPAGRRASQHYSRWSLDGVGLLDAGRPTLRNRRAEVTVF